MRPAYIVLGVLLAAPAGFGWTADAARGAEVLKRENCLQCHSLRGEGGAVAPDLARRTAQNYTPAALVSLMWNHGPAMWAALTEQKLPMPRLTETDAGDLFAYLYSVRFFDRPADAGRGKQIFEDKHCAECHSLTEPAKGPGTAVSNWTSLTDPMTLVQRMWNHAGTMKNALTQKKGIWVSLTGPELADLTLYLQNIPPRRTVTPTFTLPDPQSGKPLFDQYCQQCHKGSLALEGRLSGMTLTDVAASMWNHVPRMLATPVIGRDDMRGIVAYVWEQQYMGPAGNVGRGRKTFADKHCASCHDDPSFNQAHFVRGDKVFTPLTMISVLWEHGPQMLEQMKQRGVSWPRLAPEDISNLVAYLNTRP